MKENLNKNTPETDVSYLCKSFLNRALEEIKKFKNNFQNRQDTVWNIGDIAVELGLLELISENKLPEDIVEIVHLALDLEVPDKVYQGDVQKDTEKLIDLIEKKAEEYKE